MPMPAATRFVCWRPGFIPAIARARVDRSHPHRRGPQPGDFSRPAAEKNLLFRRVPSKSWLSCVTTRTLPGAHAAGTAPRIYTAAFICTACETTNNVLAAVRMERQLSLGRHIYVRRHVRLPYCCRDPG